MADIEPGNPQTLKADEAASQQWQAENPNTELTFARVVAAKAARRARIEQFEEKQRHRRNFVSLHEVFDWLSECDEGDGTTLAENRINIICRSLSDRKSAFQIGKNLSPWAVIASDDFSPPISMFFASDVAAVRNSSLYPDARALRALIERLWVPRDLLLNLFHEKRWPVAPWLNEPPPSKAAKKIPEIEKQSSQPAIVHESHAMKLRGNGKTNRAVFDAMAEIWPNHLVPTHLSISAIEKKIAPGMSRRGFAGGGGDSNIRRILGIKK